jgi:hypothetical protein
VSDQRLVGVSGAASFVLFAAGNALWVFDQPMADASSAEVHAFYSDASDRIVAGASLSLIAIALFVVVATGLRRLLRDGVLGDIAFGATLLAAATGLGAETINAAAAVRASDGKLTTALGDALFQTSYVLGYNAAGVALGVLLLALAVAVRPMSMWLAALGALVGLALLTPLVPFVLGPSFLVLGALAIVLLRAQPEAGR